MAEVCHGVGWVRWAKVAGTVRPSTVVVSNVLREYHTQVPLTEDQHVGGEFGSEGAHEPFGKTVRPRATRRNSGHADAHIGQDSVERRGELTSSVSNEEPELSGAITKIHDQVSDLLCGPPAIGIRGRAQQVHEPIANFQHEEHGDPLECHRALDGEELAGQHRGCLRAQELPPGRVGAPDAALEGSATA